MRLNIDIRTYLNERLPGRFEEDSRGWLTGACLFHADGRRPNLGIRPETGSYRCLSCGAHGDLVSLVQRIEGFASYEEAHDWLYERYGTDEDGEALIEFELFDRKETQRKAAVAWHPPDESILNGYKWRHPYLGRRGIAEIWQRSFEIGYDRETRSITFPWRDRRGRLITVKHRRVDNKRFWYWPRVPAGVKNSLLYGLHHIARRRDATAWICEAEIDCISLWQSGRPAVALGGAYMSPQQARELALAGVERVVLACDRDAGGQKAHETIRARLEQLGIECVDAIWPERFNGKDVNDLLITGRIDELTIESLGGFELSA